MAGKKGDLEITIIEARNCGVRGHALYCSVELKTQKNNTQKAYYTNAAKDAKWNQTFSLDLMSLDGEELLIQLFCKRNVKKDKFLGQSQMRISALNLSKEAEWHFLNDKPESELKNADTLKRSMSMSVVGNRSSVKKKDMYIVSGEILYKLNFVHRLIRAKSKAAIHKDIPPLSPPLDSISSSLSSSLSPSPLSARGSESSPSIRLSVPSVSPRTYTDFQKTHEAATGKTERPVLKSTASNRRIGANDNNAKEETSENSLSLQKSTPPDESPVDLSITEEVIIDEALKEKQKMVKEKLEQGAKLVRHMTSRIIKIEKDEGEAAVRDDKNQLEQIKKNMSELEKILEATEAEPAGFSRPRSLTHTTSARSLSRGDRDVRVNPDSVSASSSGGFGNSNSNSSSVGNSNSKSSSGLVASASRPNIGREPSLSVSEGSRSHLSHSQAATTPVVPIRKHSDASSIPRPNGIQRGNAAIHLAPHQQHNSVSSSVSASISASWTPSGATLASARPTGIKMDNNNNNSLSLSENFANVAEETKFLRVKVKFLEKNIESLQANTTTLEKEVSRLEKELDRYQREEKLRLMEEKIREREERLIAWERDLQTRAGGGSGRSSIVLPPSETDMFELPEEGMDDQQKAIQTKLKTLDAEIRTGTLRKNNLKAEAMKNAVKFKEEVLKKLNREAQKYEAKINQKIPDTDSNDESEIDSSTDDDMSDDLDGGATTPNRVRSPNLRDAPQNDAKYDALVAKLEKLDKLDELMRKLDNIKMVAGASGGDGGDGRGYAELKAELEQIQAIIFDETGKYTEKEKEDANIKYEKVSQEFQQTDEYKKEVAAALEEKRKLNEPLNKAALEKMVKVYNTNSIRDDPVIKDKAQKNPELTLIGMDPKAILSKHQNDFQQYMLRNLTLDELRAIRASLPKFRNDQKRQIDWVESLEQKIELVSKEPPKKAPAVKKAPIKLKPKTGGGGDFMAELMARQKREAAERGEVVEEEKKEVQKPAALKLGPKPVAPTPPPVNPPPPPPKLSGAPPPPPPPPRV